MSYCKDNLSTDDRQRIAENSFQVTDRHGNELHGLCPFHGEKQASFSYNFEKDLCNCLSCGASGDLVNLWGIANNYDDNDTAFAAFREQYGPTTPTNSKPRPASATRGQGGTKENTKIIKEAELAQLQPLPENQLQKCLSWGWTTETIQQLEISWHQKQNRIAIPIRQDDGQLVNIRLYSPGATENKIMSWGKGYGKSKLHPSPANWTDKPIIICEGEKDAITALSKGFNACTQTAGCNSWDDKFSRFFTDRHVIIAYDADEKGTTGAQKVAKKLSGIAKSIKIITWPVNIMPELPDHGQDLTDYFSTHKQTAQNLRDLIQTTTIIEKTKKHTEEMPEDVQRFFGGTRGTQFKPRLCADEIMTWRQLIHDPKSGIIHTWADTHWQEYDQSNIRRQVLNMLQTEGTTPRVNDVYGIVRDLAVMAHGREMNDQKGQIPIANGMFDLKTGQIHNHNPENFNSYYIDLELNMKTELPKCPLWQKFLKESVGDQATIREIQKFFGYSLTRETRHEKALLLIGPGGDGKGTILKTLQALVGDHNTSNVTLGGLQDQFHRVMLVDKLLNVATEVEATLLQSDIFKTLISGESVTAAYKHKNAFSFLPVCKFAFSANKHPNIQDTTDGLYRRLLVIEMEKQFVKQGKADLYLLDKILEEKSAIFLWAMRGIQLLEKEGFTPSEKMKGWLDKFQEINNPVLSFSRTHTEERPPAEKAWTCTMNVYEKYKKFCDKRGYRSLGESRFGIEIKKICPYSTKKRETSGKRRWGYANLVLVDDYEAKM